MNWSVGTVLRLSGADSPRRFVVKGRNFQMGEYLLTAEFDQEFWINLGAAQMLLEPA